MNNNTRNAYARPPSVLETDRLLLRAPDIEDAFALQALANEDSAFARSTVGENPNTLYANCTAIARMAEDRRVGSGAWWIVIEKATNQTVGIVGYSERSPSDGIFCAISHAQVGHGYASETIQAMLNLGRASYSLHPSTDSVTLPRSTLPTNGSHWVWHCKDSRRQNRMQCA